MLILNEGRTLVIGDTASVGSSPTLTRRQWLLLFVLVALAVPLSGLLIVDPDALRSPTAVIITSLASIALLAAIVIVRHTLMLVSGSDDVITAAFDRETATLEILFMGVFGLTREAIPFAEVHAIRQGRGEWNGEKVSEVVVVELGSGRTIVLPNRLSAKELTLLRVLTGLRRS